MGECDLENNAPDKTLTRQKRQFSTVTENNTGELSIDNLSLTIPGTKHKLVQNLNLHVDKGKSLLIIGPSGVGKSSLLRAVCGLWQAQTGLISMPEHKNLMFLPQNAYIPDSVGTKHASRATTV